MLSLSRTSVEMCLVAIALASMSGQYDMIDGKRIARTCKRQVVLCRLGLHNLLDRQIEEVGKLKVSGVMCWHCHDGAAAIATQNIVSNPNGYLLLCGRVLRIATFTRGRQSHISEPQLLSCVSQLLLLCIH